jgi:hypothetical protein
MWPSAGHLRRAAAIAMALVALRVAGGCGRVRRSVKQAREGAREAQEKGRAKSKDEEGRPVTIELG